MGYFLCAESWEYLGFFRTHINYARFAKEHWKFREREIRIAFCTLREILSRFQRFEAPKTNIRSVAQRLRNDEHDHIHCSVPSLIYVFMHVSELSSGERNNIWCTSFSEASLNEGSTNEAQRNVPFFDICICDTYDYNTSGNLLFCKRKIFYGFSKYRFALNSIFYCHHGKLNWVAAKKVLHILNQKHI